MSVTPDVTPEPKMITVDTTKLETLIASWTEAIEKATPKPEPEPEPEALTTEAVAELIKNALADFKEENTPEPEPEPVVEPVVEVATEYSAPVREDFESEEIYTKSVENYDEFKTALTDELKQESGTIIEKAIPIPNPLGAEKVDFEKLLIEADKHDNIRTLFEKEGVEF